MEVIHHWQNQTGGNRDKLVSWRDGVIAKRTKERRNVEIEREGIK